MEVTLSNLLVIFTQISVHSCGHSIYLTKLHACFIPIGCYLFRRPILGTQRSLALSDRYRTPLWSAGSHVRRGSFQNWGGQTNERVVRSALVLVDTVIIIAIVIVILMVMIIVCYCSYHNPYNNYHHYHYYHYQYFHYFVIVIITARHQSHLHNHHHRYYQHDDNHQCYYFSYNHHSCSGW